MTDTQYNLGTRSLIPLHLSGVLRKGTLQSEFNFNILSHYYLNLFANYQIGLKFHKGSNDPMSQDLEQVVARNTYLDNVSTDEFLIILDDDEVLCGSLNILGDCLQAMLDNDMYTGFINEILPDGKLKPRPRILRKKEGMMYFFKHDMIIVPDELPEDLLLNPTELWENEELNKCFNYIHKERKNSLYIPYIHIAHYKELNNFKTGKPQ